MEAHIGYIRTKYVFLFSQAKENLWVLFVQVKIKL